MKLDDDPQMKEAFDKFWCALTLEGDPLRIPNPFVRSFIAGYQAALADVREARLHEQKMVDAMRREDERWRAAGL